MTDRDLCVRAVRAYGLTRFRSDWRGVIAATDIDAVSITGPNFTHLGRVEHIELRLLTDYAAHPAGALSWRFENEQAGTGVLVASRVAVGEQCTYGFEVHGERGALAWDFRRMRELRVCLDQQYQDAAWQTRYVAPGIGETGAFQPARALAAMSASATERRWVTL